MKSLRALVSLLLVVAFSVTAILGQSGHFDTVGMYEKFTGPDSFPKASPSWRGIELHGTAQTVIVPL